MATHSSILAWEVSWIEEPSGLQSMRSEWESSCNTWGTSLAEKLPAKLFLQRNFLPRQWFWFSNSSCTKLCFKKKMIYLLKWWLPGCCALDKNFRKIIYLFSPRSYKNEIAVTVTELLASYVTWGYLDRLATGGRADCEPIHYHFPTQGILSQSQRRRLN